MAASEATVLPRSAVGRSQSFSKVLWAATATRLWAGGDARYCSVLVQVPPQTHPRYQELRYFSAALKLEITLYLMSRLVASSISSSAPL